MKQRCLLIWSILLVLPLCAWQLPEKSVSQDLPACVHTDWSVLRFPGSREAQERFYAKLDSLLSGGRSNVNIWHVGGSHVQAGHFPYRIMEDLTGMAPGLKGERGFIFPYRLARTNFDKSYIVSSTGEWEAPVMTRNSDLERPRYGITGYGARTSDPEASVGFNLTMSADTTWEFNGLRILGYSPSGKAFPYVVCGTDTLQYKADPVGSGYLFDLPETVDSVLVGFVIPEGGSFVLNGMEPLSGRHGINYYASGVNGAKVTSWLDQAEDLGRDLKLVHPDLVIFGLGINDSACPVKDFNPEKFKRNYRRMIRMVRDESPDCAFIFITNNDSYRYVRGGMTYNGNAEAVRKAMTELALEYGAAVWDLYGVMGGAHTVLTWRDEGLVKDDKLHFTKEGYTLLGDLFFNSLISDYNNSRR